MNDTILQLMQRKSVRSFTDQDIEETIVQEILQAAVQAPTAGNQQLYTILRISDPEILQKLADSCDHQPFIAEGKLVLLFCADCLKWYDAYKYAGCEPRHPGAGDLLLAVDDAMVAAQNAVVAAHSYGIGSCYIGDIMENMEEVRDFLSLPEYVFPATLLVFGYPTEQQKNRPKPERMDLQHIVHDDQYRRMDEKELRRMFEKRAEGEEFDAWVRAFCRRKHNSAFAKEMTRSVKKYLDQFLSEDSVPVPDTGEITTERLILRHYRLEDALTLYEMIGTDEQMTQYTGWNPYSTKSIAEETVRTFIANADTPHFYGWVIQHDGELIGTVGAYDFNPDTNTVEIGISIGRKYWGNGYASEALQAVLQYLVNREDIVLVTAWCAADNKASAAVMKHCGMTDAGIEKGSLEINGNKYDKLWFEYRAPVILIRDAVPEDAERILEIYSYYIENTAVTYEYAKPSLDDFAARMKHIMEKYPYLVILKDGRIEGYAYARAYIEREACDWSCETTVYLDHNSTGFGLGSKLYQALEEALQKMGIINMYAAVAWPREEDEYLNENSARFHKMFGFREIGHFRSCGCKFGRWYDLLWLEKKLGEHRTGQDPVISYPDLSETINIDS